MSEVRTFQKASKIERGLALGGLAAAVAGLVLLKFVNPTATNLLPQCPLHAMTGWNCPGCGATRGMHALLNGDILTALHFNSMLVIIVPALIYVLLLMFSVGFRGRTLTLPRQSPLYVWAILILMLGFGIVRNLPFYPFNLLAI